MTNTMARATELYEKHYMDVYRYARSWCGDSSVAEDVASDIFLALAEGKTPTSNVKGYLFTAAHNRLVNHWRKDRRLAPLEAALDESDDDHVWQAGIDIRMPRTLATINQELTPAQRHVIVLRFFEGFSLKETARVLGKTDDSVKVLQHRAMTRLRKALAEPSVSV